MFMTSIIIIFKNKKIHRVWIACYNILTIRIDIFDIHGSIISNLVWKTLFLKFEYSDLAINDVWTLKAKRTNFCSQPTIVVWSAPYYVST
jgi:hypothetical protein